MNTNLPKSPDTHLLEEKSKNFFRNTFCRPQFITREESESDYGVDFTVELCTDFEFVTNFRFQAQLKATGYVELNSDNSFNFCIETKNLNYLMNHPKSIYVIYVDNQQCLYYDYVEQIIKNFNLIEKNWHNQQTVTVKFSKKIDNPEMNNIHETIRNYWMFERQIRESVTRTGSLFATKLLIDPEKLTVSSFEEKLELIRKHGFSIINSGYSSLILEYANDLPQSLVYQPDISLVLAYALYQSGKYFSVLDKIINIRKHIGTNVNIDKCFIDYLEITSKYLIGMISSDSYTRELKSLFDSLPLSPTTVLQKIETLRRELFSSSIERRKEILEEMKKIELAIFTPSTKLNNLQYQVRLSILEAEGFANVDDFIENSFKFKMQEKMGFFVKKEERLQMAQNLIKTWQKWLIEVINLEKEIKDTKNPIIIADCIRTRVFVQYDFLIIGQTLSNIKLSSKEKEIGLSLLKDLDYVIVLYEKVQAYYYLLKTMLLKCEILSFVEKKEDATKLAKEILMKAQSLGYNDLQKQIEEFLKGNSLYEIFQQLGAKIPEESEFFLSATDENLGRFADSIIESLDIPKDRKDNVLKDLKAVQYGFKIKTNWCKYLEIIQDLRHTQSKNTSYIIDPERICKCKLHMYESKIPSINIEVLIETFKKSYCENCSDKVVL